MDDTEQEVCSQIEQTKETQMKDDDSIKSDEGSQEESMKLQEKKDKSVKKHREEQSISVDNEKNLEQKENKTKDNDDDQTNNDDDDDDDNETNKDNVYNEVKEATPRESSRKTSEGEDYSGKLSSKRRRTSSLSEDLPDISSRKRSKSIDNDDVEEVIRERSMQMLLKCFGETDKGKELANKIETAIYEELADANDHHYRSRVRSRVTNLRRNPAIVQQLLNGHICADKFSRMSADELATPQLKELREHICEDTMEEHMMGEKEKVGLENVERSDNAI